MKPLLLLISILFLLGGCASAKFTEEGKIKFSIPFDFPGAPKQELREEQKLEQMERLEIENPRSEK